MPFTDEEIETGLLNGAREGELRAELGDSTYEDLRALGAQISAENSSAIANELFGLGKPRKTIYILPGIMGSKLSVSTNLGEDLIWFDAVGLANGQVTKLQYNPATDGVVASGVFWSAYGWLRLKLTLAGYRVRFIAYDWRRPTDELGDIVYQQIAANGETDVTLVAHSMGGLLARHIAHLDADRRQISRIVTLGTPNGGSYSPVQVFRNTHSLVAKLGALDLRHTAEEIVQEVLREFPGLVEMMPDPALRPDENYFDFRNWPNTGTRPVAQVLANALAARRRLPVADDRFHQIIGIGEKTVVSATVQGNELSFRYSLDGDGTVPRDLAELDDLPKTFIEASHGGLVKDRSVLSTLEKLMKGEAPRTFAERERYVPSLNLEALQTDVLSETELRTRIRVATRRPVHVEDLGQEFLGTPSWSGTDSRETIAAAAPKVQLIGGYPVNLVRKATENWRDAAPLRDMAQEAVENQRSIDAESDDRKPIYARRKVSQLMKIAEETAGQVALPAELERIVALAGRDPDAAVEALLNERVLNEAEEFLSVLFVKRAAIVTKSIGRIVARGTRQGFGTGFLVAPGVLITNQHVLGNEDDARNSAVQFDYELNYRYRQGKSETFVFRPQDLFYANRSLDFALVAVAGKGVDHGYDLTNYGYLPLDEKVGKIRAEAPVNIIQHPQAGLKQVVFRDSKIFPLPSELDPGNSYSGKSVDTAAHYSGDTKRGSSGSPVFNDAWEVVALHHSAVAELDDAGRLRLKDGTFKAAGAITDGDEVKWVANEGIRISRIMKHLRGLVNDGMFQGTELGLLQGLFAVGDKATQNGAFDRPLPRPIFAGEPEAVAVGGETTATSMQSSPEPETGPETGRSRSAGQNWVRQSTGGLSITVPLTVELSLGSTGEIGSGVGLGHASEGGSASPGTASGFSRPDNTSAVMEERKYSIAQLVDRKGYDPDFLGISVPFPRPLDTAPGRLAQRLDGGGSKLDYDHYSVVMNAERRLAYVSAGNHDPLAPFKPARKKEPWSLDPRISENEQIGNWLYKHNDLDRGHLLRRVDGSWGHTEEAALRADHDTYFWTNISPQHERLNQSKLKGVWGLLENSVTDQAKATSTRYSVFNGPIFGEKDREHRGIRIPSGFFKVVAFVANGTLSALAFRLGQEELLVDLPLERIEANEFGVFQVPVTDLAKLVHLDFGPLAAADTFVKRQVVNENAMPGYRQKPIGRLADIVT